MGPASLCRGIVTALLLVIACAAQAKENDASNNVIYLTTEQTTGSNMGQGLLIREQVRQAILIAARDEMGLTTRDAALREFDPASPQATQVHLKVDLTKSLTVEIVRNGAKVWSGEMGLTGGSAHLHDNLTNSCEQWSRKEFITALTLAGFTGVTHTPADPKGAQVGDDITALLARMNSVSQFDAVRRLHQAIRDKGPSRAASAALVRGYANLGALTELQWYAADRVFKARSLLYAQRMVAAEPNSAFPLWHRAYARAMAGFYGAALADLDAAAKLQPDAGPAPAWVAELRAFCNYDATALTAIARQTPDQAPFADFLELLNVIGSGTSTEVLLKGKLTLEADPENPYALERMSAAAGVSYGHVITVAAPSVFIGKTLLQTLPACAQLPADVSTRITAVKNGKTDVTDIAAIWQALVAAGADPKIDTGEPSWTTLGRMIQETHFLQTLRRAQFLRYKYGSGADATEFVKQTLPLIGTDHPFRSFVESFAVDRSQEPQRYDDLVSDVRLIDPAPPTDYWLETARSSQPKGVALYKENRARFYACSDNIARDMEKQYVMSNDAQWQLALAARLQSLSPRSPYAIGIMVARDWKAHRDKAPQYEKWAPGCSYLLGVLARKYMAEDRDNDAARCFKAYLEVARDSWVYQDLAALHLKRGDEDGWLASLQAYINDSEDFGLSHDYIRDQIARGFMDRGKYHRALPYADQAAQCGAGWALDTAAECHEGLGQVRAAATLYRDSAQRYESSCFVYWFWYQRSKDPASADSEKMVLDYIANTKLVNHGQIAAFYLIKGDYKSAGKVYAPAPDKPITSGDGLQIALAADAAGDTALRDRALQAVIDLPRPARPSPTYIAHVGLTRLFQKALADPSGKLDLVAVDRLFEKQTPASQTTLNVTVGRFLQNRGENHDALHYLRQAIQGSVMNGAEFNVAWAALVKMGLDPRTLRDPVKDK